MMPDAKITPPYGYDEIVPLQKTDRVLLPNGATPAFCRSINVIALSSRELVLAGRDYPIVFASPDGGASFAPIAVLGLDANQNLFINAQGEWDPACYVPVYVRRYPFCISKLYADGVPRSERMVCVAQAYVDRSGVVLFDGSGAPTAHWSPIEKLLAEYEADLDATAQSCASLAKLGLFSPFQFQVYEAAAPSLTLHGMYRIDESRLAALKPLSLKALVTRGLMSVIYAHFHSLENFARLYRRSVAAQADNPPVRNA